ncbi:AraC-type DNA-binding protein [Flexibacter flexilis DSM 6793]|uniref:AraC-type DNA-binding protein n=1 Tax=Flexibacter flexilis DSM 6793 TaxID=927664 RepID=A0A1I1HWI8_9BACT|nr:AraC family transcriptional regulator [Flexibacter flexilis]SFC27942.1 AraC-type DNA-binding protein [Flexibacter flexilis DSM 6793]
MKEKTISTPNILLALGQWLGAEVHRGRLEIPEKFGNGYCAGFVLNENIRLFIFNYHLHQDVTLKNVEDGFSAHRLLFKFQHIFPHADLPPNAQPSVLIATSTLQADAMIPVHSHTATINIEIDAAYLCQQLSTWEQSPILASLLRNTQPLLFEQMISPTLQKVVAEILNESVDESLALFFLKIKAEELVCRLLMELQKRAERQVFALNVHDVANIYKVKNQILDNLNTPPLIKDLAVLANMSPTKLKLLFKQIFGNSIFCYYQELRMKEAARLLAEQNLSVSEVGYRLGFTNLSHFSRVFEEHIGTKPKKYTMTNRI